MNIIVNCSPKTSSGTTLYSILYSMYSCTVSSVLFVSPYYGTVNGEVLQGPLHPSDNPDSNTATTLIMGKDASRAIWFQHPGCNSIFAHVYGKISNSNYLHGTEDTPAVHRIWTNLNVTQKWRRGNKKDKMKGVNRVWGETHYYLFSLVNTAWLKFTQQQFKCNQCDDIIFVCTGQ